MLHRSEKIVSDRQWRVKLERPPRLADFALWVSACEEALGMKPGEAMAACQANCIEARDLALEASPLYQPMAELAREGFTGTVAELHARLDFYGKRRAAPLGAMAQGAQRPG